MHRIGVDMDLEERPGRRRQPETVADQRTPQAAVEPEQRDGVGRPEGVTGEHAPAWWTPSPPWPCRPAGEWPTCADRLPSAGGPTDGPPPPAGASGRRGRPPMGERRPVAAASKAPQLRHDVAGRHVEGPCQRAQVCLHPTLHPATARQEAPLPLPAVGHVRGPPVVELVAAVEGELEVDLVGVVDEDGREGDRAVRFPAEGREQRRREGTSGPWERRRTAGVTGGTVGWHRCWLPTSR